MIEFLSSLLLLVVFAGIPAFFLYQSYFAPGIKLRDDEHLLLKASASLSIDRLMLAGIGSLYLTDQRLMWRPAAPILRFLVASPAPQDIRLTDITNVHALSKDERNKIGMDVFLRPQKGLRGLKLEVEALGHLLFFGIVDWNPFRGAGEPERWRNAILTARTAPAAQRFMPESVLLSSPSKSMAVGTLLTFAVAGVVAIFGIITSLGALADGDVAIFAIGALMLCTQGAVIAYLVHGMKRLDKPRAPED
jgi:hypothetical protein